METKAFWKSKTFQGLILSILGFAFPKYAPLLSDAYPAVLDLIAQGVQVVGIVWAGIGRATTDGVKIGLVSKPAE